MKKNGQIIKAAIMTFAACIVFFTSTALSQSESTDFSAPVTLNLKDAKVTDVFRLLAMQYNLNIVLSPSVSGVISLRLSNVTLAEALDVILEASDSKIVRTDNIMHVYSRAEKEQRDITAGEMITEIFQVNYVDPSSLIAILKDYLSKSGTIKTFRRKATSGSEGNSPMLIITDYPQNLDSLRAMYNKLDTETRQVMIVAKIVETNLSDADILGTEWNIGASMSGSPAAFDTRYGGKIKYGTLNLDGFGAAYQRIMEDTSSNLLSNATVAVMDGEKAHIHVGDVIPVGVNTVGAGGGGNVNFGTTGVQQWEIGVTIDVTPVVINDELVRMHIQPEISSLVEFTAVGSGDAPITSTRVVDTRILLRSGETIVIGGLVQNTEGESQKKVPILGDLPLIGSVFRKKEIKNNKVNLLIFITGTIMDKKGETFVKLPPLTQESVDETGEVNEVIEIAPEIESVPEEQKEINVDSFLEYK